jgi:hypothetical protein
MSVSGSMLGNSYYPGRMQIIGGFFGNTVMAASATQSGNSFGAIFGQTVVVSGSITSSFVQDRSLPGSIGLQGISFGAPTDYLGTGNFGRHLQVGVQEDTTVGSPTIPSLRIDYPGAYWRFRWVVTSGSHSITCLAQQSLVSTLPASYAPSIVVKANPGLGLNFDQSASGVVGSSIFQLLGPVTFSVTSNTGSVVWVELHNNNLSMSVLGGGGVATTPVWFDHIVIV